ncbi:MAG: ATP-binding protein [Chloroflexota bacterium]|nr:ATP-binding protein [Chloroflexota bacterium]
MNASNPPPEPAPVHPEEEWLEQARLLRLIADEQVFGGALRALLLGLAPAAWTLNGRIIPAPLFFTLWVILLGVVLITWRKLQPVGRLKRLMTLRWIGIGLLTDILLVVLILLADPSAQGDVYLLLPLLSLKTLFLYGSWTWSPLLPFLLIALYALVLLVHEGSWHIWFEPFFWGRVVLLVFVGIAVTYVAEALYEAREQARHRNLRLAQGKADLDTRTQVLAQTATNLANRVLELRTLQEGMKAINSSLDLDELLDLIVENASEVFGGASCAIGLRHPDGSIHVAARSPGKVLSLEEIGVRSLEALAEQVVRTCAPALVDNAESGRETVTSAMAVPMVVEGEPIGALMASRTGRAPFTVDDQQRLSAFADQASLAVKNSRLYEQVEDLYQEVKERSAELEAVLDSIGDAVIVTGPHGHVRLTNPVANVILGIPDEFPPGTPLPEEVLRGGFEEHLRSTLDSESGDPVLGELTVHSGRLNSDRTYQALSASLQHPDGRPRGVVTVLRDVTAAKELEQLKSNFVGTISHELKTPLHSIKGFVDIILHRESAGPLTEVQRDFLTTVREETLRLEHIIMDLLEFNRLESGQIKLNPEPFDMRVLAESVIEKLRPTAEEGSVTLQCEIREDLPVEGDRLRLEQVLKNLISNALKFTPPGGSITVMGKMEASTAEIVVCDTGIGIPFREQERIFERFYQVDSSQKRKYGGTGLGLAICKHIVERHGGCIWVESEEGAGSAFHFTVPHELATVRPLTVDFSRLEGE